MTNTDNNYLTEEDIEINIADEYYFRDENVCALVEKKGYTAEQLKQQILSNQEKAKKYDSLMAANHEVVKYNISMSSLQESIKSIREYLAVMSNEPEGYILISEVYHSIRKMLNDE